MLAVMLTVFALPAFAEASDPDQGSQSSQGILTASTLSDGVMMVIVGISCAIIFGLGGFFVGRETGKKSTSLSTDTSKKQDK